MHQPQTQRTIGQRFAYALLGAAVLLAGVLLVWRALITQAAEPLAPTPLPVFTSTLALPSATLTPSVSPSETLAPTETATATPLPTDTPFPTSTPTLTITPTPSLTPLPQPTPDGVCRALRVPILMYHYVSIPPPGADAVRRDLSVSPQRFEEHLRYLRDAGYVAVTLYDLVLSLQAGYPLPDKPVIITFDDGYRDNYTQAFPLLHQYDTVATFFLVTTFIDEGQADYVTWDQVVEMDAAGMSMESHSYTHPDLRGRDVGYLAWQMLGSKEAIEARTHKPVRFFAYPSGKYDDLAMRVLHSAHYWGAVTITSGMTQCSDRLFELERIRVRGSYTADGLAAVLAAFEKETAGADDPCTMTPSP